MLKKRRNKQRGIQVAAIATVIAGVGTTTGKCADPPDPLLDLFVKKGFVTQDEANAVKAEADAMRSNQVATAQPPSKWKLSNGLKNIELFGDVRLRYEDRRAEDPKHGFIELDRLRYAVRLGLRGEVYEDFYYGLRLETASNPRSPWATFATSTSGAPYQGPFGKSTAGINVGQAYIGWHPEDWVDFTFGGMPNPLYTTPMVWDPDLNPTGFAERFKYTIGQATLFANFGQFLYEDTNPTKASNGYFGITGANNLYTGNGTPVFLTAWQGGLTYNITPKISLTVAPDIYYYFGQGANVNQSLTLVTPSFSNTFVGQGATGSAAGFSGFPVGFYDGFSANQTGINNLLVLEIPFELNATVDRFHIRTFGDYAYNLQGSKRATAAFEAAKTAGSPGGQPELFGIQQISSPQTGDVSSYQVGIGIGSTNVLYGPTQGPVYENSSARHAWELRTYWQHSEQYSLDPNLVDSDFFEGRLNMEGIFASAAYGFSPNVIGTLRYGYANRINNKLGTGGSNQDIPQMNPINHYYIWQVDMTFRF
jgi:hypothetical protein